MPTNVNYYIGPSNLNNAPHDQCAKYPVPPPHEKYCITKRK